MKSYFAVIASALLLLPATVAADDVKLADLPAAVRAAVEKETAGGKITEIEKETKRGKVVYEVEYERGDKDYELHVAEDGKVLANRED